MMRVAQSEPTATASKPRRRSELDLLRGLVVLALIPFHAATYFISGAWAPRLYTPSLVALVLIDFSVLLAMPMMFFIAGMGASYSLRKRSARTFLTERIRRIVVPFLMGVLLLLPPVQYYTFKRLPLFEETFAQFYPTFFNVTPRWVFPPFLTGPRYAAHQLWFLRNLFVYTLVLLPLFLWLRSVPLPALARATAVA